MSQERRRFLRGHTRLTTFLKILETGRVQRVLTRNVSSGGVCLITEELIASGALVEVKVKFPDREQSIAFQGVVKWSQLASGPEHGSGAAETGVQFISIDPKDRALIAHYVKLSALPPESGGK